MSRTIDTHVSRLRRMLQLDGSNGWHLEAVYQRGYRLTQMTAERPRPWTPRW